MKPMQFTCQNCDQQHEKIKHFKVHIRSHSHKKVVANLFHTAVHQGPVFFPICVVLDYLRNPEKRNPLIGLDMVTLFITPEKYGSFYLCHVCEQQLSTADVVHHLCSEGHYFKYLTHSNPELLHFAWLEDSFSYLEFSAKKENSNNGSGNLRIFELPAVMLQRGKGGSYHQVMSMFSLTKHLVERVMAGRPQRKTLQAYMMDPIRKNPLLGLNFLLEYSCTEGEQHCGYLCLLCKKKLQAIESISHCISFDHVYCYLKTFHPSMINCPKSSYTRYSYASHKKIFSMATRAQNDSPHRELQNTHVNLSNFNDIDSCSYEAALGKLQLIRKETNQSELMVAVAPGAQISFEPETKKSSADLETTHSSSPAEQTAEKTHKESAGWKDDRTCRVLCVECNKTLSSTSDYKLHIKDKEHYLKLVELFGPGGYCGSLSVIKLYDHMWSNCGNTSSSPLIGLQLLTVFVDRQSQCYNPPIYLCHACELNIPVSSVCTHLSSPHHYFNVFKFTNPDLVYLVSQNLDPILEFAQEVAMRQGKDEMVLRVCEIPTQLCRELRNMAYNKIFTVIWKNYNLRQCVEVQRRMTLQSYSKSSDRKSPLLGLQFMVKYSTARSHLRCGYFCLLCESKLSERDAIAHVLSLTHVCAYLNVAHPGSLTKEDTENKSLVADLAEQAERVSSGALQEVVLDDGKFFEVEKSTFKTAMDTLQLIFKAEGLGELKFSVAPGDKLVPSNEKNSQNCSSQCVEESSPTSHDQINLHAECTETTKMDSHSPRLTPTHAKPQNTSANSDSTAHPVESSVQVEVQLGLNPTSTPLPVSAHTEQFCLQQNETQSLKQAVCPCPNPAKAKDSYPVMKHPQPRDTIQKQTKKLNQKTGKSSQSPAHVKIKRQPVSQASPTSTELWDYLRMTKREPVIGLSSVTECHTEGQPPFYVCTTCTERFPENSITKHLTNQDHQYMYLKSIKYVPLLDKKKVKAKWLRNQSIMVERSQGYGQAQVLDLETKDYHHILSAPILTALGKLRDSLRKLISTDDEENARATSLLDDHSCDESNASKVLKRVEKTEEKDTQDLQRDPVMAECSKPDTALMTAPVSNDPTQSSPHLWSYLTSPTRTQPIIGLSMITEYRTSTHQDSFLCSCCKQILSTSCYVAHLISPKHRFNYIKNKHSELVALWGDKVSLTCKIAELQEKAKILQDQEGWGCIKVVEKESLKKKEQEERKAEEPEASQTRSEMASTGQQDQNELNLTKLLKKKKKKKKKSKPSAMIGLNFVTCVAHDKKKLFFCELCSVRCHLDHLSSVAHRKIYVEYKYPGWTASGANMGKKLHKIALRLAAVERSTGIGMKKLDVNDKVFTALRTAPLGEALSKLQLLQTSADDGVKLSASASSLQTNPGTASDDTYATGNIVKDPMPCSSTSLTLVQQQKTPFTEKSEIPDNVPTKVPLYHMCPVEPCSLSSVSASSCPSSSSVSISLNSSCDPSCPLTPSTNLDAPDRSYSPISPPLPPCYSSTSASLPLSSATPDPPPLSSPYEALSQCHLVPPVGVPYPTAPPAPVNSTVFLPTSSAPPLFRTVSNSNHTSTVLSLPTTSEHLPAPPSSSSLMHPQSSFAEWKSGDRSQPVLRESILGEESRPLAITQPLMYRFPNLPIVTGQSRASAFLKVSNTEPVVGLSNILECRKIPQATFFLCLNCAEHVSRVDICDHMTSERHQYLTIRAQYPEIFQEWQWETISNMLIRDMAGRLALLEKHFDAKVIMLSQKQYECLHSADFHDAIKILHQMYGPEQRLQSFASCVTGQDQTCSEMRDPRVLQDYMEADGEAYVQQSSSLSPSQTKQDSLHTGQVPHRALESMQGGFSRINVVCTPTMPELQASQSPQKADTQAEEPHTLHQSKAQTAESDSRDHEFYFPESSSERKKTSGNGCANSAVLQTQSTAGRLQPGLPAHTFPCVITIKQEQPDKVSHESCGFGPPSLEMPSSGQASMTPFKHPTDLKEYVGSKRAAPDAVVGLSSVIECLSEGQSPLYLCVSCSSILNHDLIINHLVKCGHRNNYLRARYPWLFDEMFNSDSRTQSRTLMWLAHRVEKDYEDEPGHLQEMKMECADFKQTKGMSFEKAIMQLQKIRKKQNLPALQTCISPKIRKDLVKQEKVETEVTPHHSLDFPGTIPQEPTIATKRKAAKPDLCNLSQPSVKQLKIQSRATSSQKVVEDSGTTPKNKDSCPTYRSTKSNKPTQKSSEQTKLKAKTKHDGSIPSSCKENLKLDPQLKARISDLHSGKQDVPPSHSKSTRVLSNIIRADESKKVDAQVHNVTNMKKNKLKVVDTYSKKSHSNPSTQTDKETLQYCSFTTSHSKCSSSLEIPSIVSEFPVNKSNSLHIVTDGLFEVQKEASFLPAVHSDQSLLSHSVPLPSTEPNIFLHESSTVSSATVPENSSSSSGDLDQSSHTCKKAPSPETLDKTVCKAVDSVVDNSQERGLASIQDLQQKKSHFNIDTMSTPSLEEQGLEISRLPDMRPLMKKRSHESAWNYENRQFNSEAHITLNTSIVANSSSESVAMEGQYFLLPQQNCSNEQNQDLDWRIPTNSWDSSAYAGTGSVLNSSASSTLSYPIQTDNLYLSVASGVASAAPSISPVMHGYALPYQFLGVSQSNPDNTSKPIYQSQPVYQSFQHPETHAYYDFYTYNQALHPNQVATVNESVCPSGSTPGYEGALNTPAGWQQSQYFFNSQKST